MTILIGHQGCRPKLQVSQGACCHITTKTQKRGWRQVQRTGRGFTKSLEAIWPNKTWSWLSTPMPSQSQGTQGVSCFMKRDVSNGHSTKKLLTQDEALVLSPVPADFISVGKTDEKVYHQWWGGQIDIIVHIEIWVLSYSYGVPESLEPVPWVLENKEAAQRMSNLNRKGGWYGYHALISALRHW